LIDTHFHFPYGQFELTKGFAPAMDYDKENIATSQHDERADATHESGRDEKFSQALLGEPGVWQATLEEARAANVHEHSLSIRQAVRKYPYAVLWSLCVSMSIIMEGYDTILIGSLYAYPSYAKQFGELDSTGLYQIPAQWQSAMGSGPQAGAIIGALANGFIIQRFGYRPAFLLGLVLMTAFVFVSFFGMSVQLQAVGQILCG
jgi:SP family general alpha glucoside:H+ symporter-like MFS transporter